MVVKVVVVEELQPHVDGGEVVELPPAEEVLQLPVDAEVWAQARWWWRWCGCCCRSLARGLT